MAVICTKCQKECVPTGCTTGYGRNDKGEAICFECCADLDREEMAETGRITLYLNHYGTRGVVSNWPGTLKFPCMVQQGRHNLAGTRYDVWFRDEAGRNWWGVQYGEFTQITHCKRLKEARV